MSSVQNINTKAGAIPYKGLFSSVSIIPSNRRIAYISTQWACDPETAEPVQDALGDYYKQAVIVWEQIYGILKELGAEAKDIVHRTVNFMEFNDDIGKAVTEAQLSVTPEEWKADAITSSLTFKGVAHMPRPGLVYTVEVVVALPDSK